MRRLRVLRLIAIEGDEEWIKQTLARAIKKDRPLLLKNGLCKVEEIERYEDIQFRLENDPSMKSILLDQVKPNDKFDRT